MKQNIKYNMNTCSNTENKLMCDMCKEEKETDTCCNEVSWGKVCTKNICSECCIPCENCGIGKINMCSYCCIICNKCKKNICYKCKEKYGRCEKCWYESPLCHFCGNVEAEYKCDICYKEVCYEHKKMCYNCGTKCMDCHENYYKASCKDCEGDLSSEDVVESNINLSDDNV